MVKRMFSAALWFLTFGWGFNLLALATGWPSVVGYGLAAGVALFMAVDPLGLVWPVPAVPADRHVATTEQVALPQMPSGVVAAR